MNNICYEIEKGKSLTEYLGEPEHHRYAVECEKLLTNFNNLRPFEARCHGKKPYPYTTFYVGFNNSEDENGKLCFILHFEVTDSDLWIYFRFLDYAPEEVLDKGAWWIRGKSKYLHFKDYEGNKKRLIEIIREYVNRIKPHYAELSCKKRKPCD
jgi:hypothetical protein